MFQGSMVALITPMSSDGRLDSPKLAELIEWHIAEGTDAIVAAGTTGESATLETLEHADFLEQVIRLVRGRLPVIAGTGSNSTAQTMKLTQRAAELGADAALLVVPYYNKPTQEGLYQHYRTIADAVSMPLILYNVPSRTITDMFPETVERLAGLTNVVGIKEASGKLERLSELRDRCGPDFDIYSGDDATACEWMAAGAQGVISVTANIAPGLMHELCMAALGGELAHAQAVDRRLAILHKVLFVESNPIPVKWALSEMGRISNVLRLPLTPLSQHHYETVRNALIGAGLL